MKDYVEHIVWSYSGDVFSRVFLSHGLALDTSGAHKIFTGILFLNEDCDKSQDYIEVVQASYVFEGGRVYSPWFEYRYELDRYLKGKVPEAFVGNSLIYYKGILDLRRMCVPKFPMPVVIRKQEDGRFFVRIQRNPDAIGSPTSNEDGSGKVYFPDKRWTNVSTGSAMVSISHEFNSYGFVRGHMIDFSYTDLSSILEYTWDRYAPNSKLYHIMSPNHGDYFMMKGGEEETYFRFSDGGISGKVEAIELPKEDVEDAKMFIVEEFTLGDAYLRNSFSLRGSKGCTFTSENLYSRFKRCSFSPFKFDSVDSGGLQWTKSSTVFWDEFADAFYSEMVDVYNLVGTNLYQIIPVYKNLYKFAVWQKSKLDRFIVKCNEFNERTSRRLLDLEFIKVDRMSNYQLSLFDD